MTVICALIDGAGDVWIGSDRQWTTATDRPVFSKQGKWAVHEGAALAISGPGLLCSLLLDNGPEILRSNPGPFEAWSRLMDLAKTKGLKAVQKDEDQFGDHGCSSIFVNNGRVWDIDCTGAYVEMTSFWARGSGAEYALGAMQGICDFTKDGARLLPGQVVRRAVEASCRWSTGCGGEPWFQKIERRGSNAVG